MPDSPRTVARIVWGTLRAGVYVILAGLLLFVALTRTEVGRNQVRQKLQSAFDARFAGSLHVGTLRGTLLQDLQATDVQLRDESGRAVVSVDSVAAEPSWHYLLTGELSIASLTLVRPHLALHRRADDGWNLRSALQHPSPTSSDRSLGLSLQDLEIKEGRITTTRSGAAPSSVQKRWLFDYTESELNGITLDASLDWSGARRHVSLRSLQMTLPDKDLTLESAQISLTKQIDQWTLTPFSLELGDTRIEAEGTIQPSSRTDAPAMTLTLAESRLDYDELRRLVPRLPLRNEMTVEGKIGRSANRFVVNRLTMRHRRSRAVIEGTVFGLPDSLDVDARLLQSQIRPSDLRSVWPDAPTDRIQAIGPVQLDAEVRGTVAWRNQKRPTFDLTSTLSAQGSPGAVRGSLDVTRSTNASLTYDGTVRVDSLNLAPLTDIDRLDSHLTGRATLDGTGTRLGTLRGELDASLSSSRVGTRRFDAAHLTLMVDQQNAQGELSVQQPGGGTLSLQGTLSDTGAVPVYDALLSTNRLDLDGLHPALPTSQLNATLSAKGYGDTWQTLTGSLTLAVDSSKLQHGDDRRLLPPHQTTLTLTESSSPEPRLQLEGTIGSMTIDGTPLAPALRRSGQLWGRALRRAVEEEIAGARRTPPDSALSSTPETPLLGSLRNADVPPRPRNIYGELAIHRMDLLQRWWPAAPDRGDGVHATTTLTISPDTLSASGTLRATHLEMGSRRVDSLRATYSMQGSLQPDLLNALTTSVSVQAASLHLGKRHLTKPTATLSLTQGRGTLDATVQGIGRTGPFRLASNVHLDNGLRLRIRDLYAGAGQYDWTTERPATVVIHPNAITADSLSLESPRPYVDRDQNLLLHGTLSSAPSDTLHAKMTDLLLYPVGEMLSLPRPLGGRLNGEVAMTGGWAQPQLRSNFTVDRLTFDRRVLGDLRAQTRLTSDSPDLLVEAALTPGPSTLESLDGPPLVPDGPRKIEDNALQMEGRIRLPGWAASTAASTTDQLDLTVNIDRADLFFFKYIFDDTLANIRGYTAGTVHIGGHFFHPVFDADLSIQDGHFTLPKFGLSYTASGPVQIDRQGIHVRKLSVADNGGSGVVRGSILFNDYRFFSFDLSATLDELSIINVTDSEDLPFYGQIRASGPVTLTGPLPNAKLRSEGARTTPDSELYIPVTEGGVDDGSGFFVFADSTGTIPDLRDLTRRDNILSDRPEGESSFLDGLEIDINVLAPDESTVHLVFDPVVGDVVTAVGSGRVQLQRQEGEFRVFGNYAVTGGTYLFTAGEVFVRRFNINEGTISWDGPPTNAQLNLKADYRTRASPAGLPGYDDNSGRIPVRVKLDIGGRVETPEVNLSLARVRDERTNLVGSRTLDAILNQSDRTTEYATSVLLTNTFLLTTESFTGGGTNNADGTTSGSLATAGNQLAFNSVSQLVASQLNRYLGAALPNVDLNFGVQGENPNDLDLIYGIALRLLNERLVIRGEGVYSGDESNQRRAEGPQGEFVVEVRLSNRVSAEAFYRRSGDELTRGQTLTSSTGAGLSYQTEFPNWQILFERVFGWLLPDDSSDDDATSPDRPDDETPPSDEAEEEEESPDAPVVRRSGETGTAPDPRPEGRNR